MQTTINLLLDLQKLDLERKYVESRKSALPENLKKLGNELERLRHALAAAVKKLKQQNVEIDRIELDIRSFEEKINRLQVQLNSASSNREYKTLEHEIGGFGADKDVLEDSMLKAMSEAEKVEFEIRSLKKQVEEQEKEFEKAKIQSAIEETELQSRIRSLESHQQELGGQIDPDIFNIYKRLINRYDGEVVVPVNGQACAGCHMSVTPQTRNLLMQDERMVQCKFCGRILYLNE